MAAAAGPRSDLRDSRQPAGARLVKCACPGYSQHVAAAHEDDAELTSFAKNDVIDFSPGVPRVMNSLDFAEDAP
jgi:hypothetical protein